MGMGGGGMGGGGGGGATASSGGGGFNVAAMLGALGGGGKSKKSTFEEQLLKMFLEQIMIYQAGNQGYDLLLQRMRGPIIPPSTGLYGGSPAGGLNGGLGNTMVGPNAMGGQNMAAGYGV